MILNEIHLLFSSVFLAILQIFSPEVTLIRDQGCINVSAYDPKGSLHQSRSKLILDQGVLDQANY